MHFLTVKIYIALCYTVLLLPLLGAETIEDYICTKKFSGCRVDYKLRSCLEEHTTGCYNPFPYKDMQECHKDFYGQGNICDVDKPCKNRGVCSPIIQENHTRTFKCECSSTGFYGKHCEIKCPDDLSAQDPKTLPCLVI